MLLSARYIKLAANYFCRKEILLIFLFSIDIYFFAYAQQKSTRQTALDAFNKGNYELAFTQFSDLLAIYPRDPVYKYYSGVSLVQMQKDPEKAIELLTEARRDDAVVRTVPADVLFWMGRAQQMAGRFTEAITSFSDFTGQAGRKTARELGVQGFIQQCNEKRGQLTGSDINIPEPEIIKKSEASTGKDPAVQAEEVTVKKEPSVYRPQEADSFVKARDSVKPETVRVSEISQQKETMETEPEKTLADSTFEAIFDEHLTEAVRQPSASGVLMLFSADPKPFYDPGEKIRINPDHPPGLIYRIQVAVFRNQVEPSYFKGISPVYGIRNASSGLTTYYAGMFRKNDDAKKALPQVRQKGFKDAFIVAFSGGKPVSPERAAILEKEWGVIPFRPDERIIEELQADTIPPTLSFRVEVIRSKKPVSEQNYDELKKLAGARGLDIKTIPDGNIVYLIGQFITYESAGSYADLLVRNGYRDAKVVAWLGKREIPVETAKQLFRSLE